MINEDVYSVGQSKIGSYTLSIENYRENPLLSVDLKKLFVDKVTKHTLHLYFSYKNTVVF